MKKYGGTIKNVRFMKLKEDNTIRKLLAALHPDTDFGPERLFFEATLVDDPIHCFSKGIRIRSEMLSITSNKKIIETRKFYFKVLNHPSIVLVEDIVIIL